ncbi:MAG: PaaI family thioesterase [Chloroflexota bacterium]|nr:PaaI family thioesterase [Chloroflexota bacterium]
MTSEVTAPGVVTGAGVPRFELAAHNCFGCGTLNANGLQVVHHIEPGRSWTELTLDRRFEGWQGVIHGGILCTILDEVMAWALVGRDMWGLTARMSVEFKRPVEVGRRIRAIGEVSRARRRVVETTGQILDLDSGAILATATGVYVAADETRRGKLREQYGFRLVDAPGGVDGPAPDPQGPNP